jgi:hypothetical protein
VSGWLKALDGLNSLCIFNGQTSLEKLHINVAFPGGEVNGLAWEDSHGMRVRAWWNHDLDKLIVIKGCRRAFRKPIKVTESINDQIWPMGNLAVSAAIGVARRVNA